MTSRSVFLRVGTHDAEQKLSQSEYRVSIQHWPAELNQGARGVSLGSVTFPINEPNINVKTNRLRWEPTTNTNSYTVTGSHSLTWRYRTKGDIVWSPIFTYNAGAAAQGVYTATSFQDLVTDFQNTYNEETGLPGTDVVFGQPGETQAGLTNRVWNFLYLSTTHDFEFTNIVDVPNSLLLLLGFTDVTRTIDRHNGIVGSHSPTSNITDITPGTYTSDVLADAIEADIYLQEGAIYNSGNFTIIEGTAHDERYVVTNTSGNPLIIWPLIFGSDLAPLIGIGFEDDEYLTFDHVQNLHGNNVVYLHSEIIAGRSTVDGDGGITSIMKPIPITVSYRDLQTYVNDDSGIPDILFPRNKIFTDIDISLRDTQRRIVDIGSGELEVYLKVYY